MIFLKGARFRDFIDAKLLNCILKGIQNCLLLLSSSLIKQFGTLFLVTGAESKSTNICLLASCVFVGRILAIIFLQKLFNTFSRIFFVIDWRQNSNRL